ncbi:MAG: ComEC/Rec2 family competence protein [Solirubrobacterales bacterium]
MKQLRRYPRHVLAGALAGGLALTEIDPLLLFALAALGALLLTAAQSPAHVAVAAAGLLLAGAAVGSSRLAAIDADPLAHAPRSELTLSGHLVQLPRVRETGVTLRLRVAQPRQLIEVRSRAPLAGHARIGDGVIVCGTLRSVSAGADRSPGAAMYARYLQRNGVRRRMNAREVRLTGERRGGAYGVVDAIRSRAEDALARGLQPEPAALLRGMVLGGDAGLSEQTAEDFRVAGLSHILAVSGANVLLIVVLMQAILVLLGAPRGTRLCVQASVILLYVALCGAQASVIRAGAMGLAGVATIAASRPSSRVYALILGAIVVLFFNPRASADVGAQLSFAAVLGMMAFTRPLADRLTRLPRWAAEGFAATAGATVATAPLMAHHFDAVSIVSLAANVLGEPLIGPIVWIGSLTAALGQLSIPLASLLGAPNSFLLGALIELARASASVPGAQVGAGGFGVPAVIAAYAAIALIAAMVHGAIPAPSARAVAPLAAIGLIATCSWTLIPARGQRLVGPAIEMLDVGQGDATLLLGDGCAALIDGGPPGERLEAKLRALGVRRLDAVLTTHPEDDHFGGVLELARSGRIRIGTLLDGGGNTPRPDYAELRALMTRAGAARIDAVAGAHWSCPGVDVKVIGPAPQPPDAPPPAEPNMRAAVTEIRVGALRMFASGDAESPQLLGLPLAPTEILKMPHHGSDDPGLPQLLARLRPRAALIGVGAGNRYGHPTPGSLAGLQSAGVAAYRTDRDGAIIVRPAPGGFVVSTAGAAR